jgi:peptidoglycan/LPS O-acetylase OafA/YrhL
MRERFHQLDSLRGLAALAVVSHHCLMTLPDHGGWFWRAPFRNGHEAVVLFFVLSGFVLNLPFLAREAPATKGYGEFLFRRFCRIYLPYLPALCAALAVAVVLGTQRLAGVGNVINLTSGIALWPAFLRDLDLLTSLQYFTLDPVVWTIVIELRIALVFPLLAALANRLNAFVLLAFGLGLDIATCLLEPASAPYFGTTEDFFLSGHYVFMFLAGMVLARYKDPLVSAYRARGAWLTPALLAFGGVLIFKHTALLGFVQAHAPTLFTRSLLPFWRIDDWGATLGVSLIMVAALGSPKLATALCWRPIAFYGEISYSLYLYHSIVAVALMRLFVGHVPIGWLALAIFPLTTLVAWLSWRFVERPAMRLGRWLTRKPDTLDPLSAERAA